MSRCSLSLVSLRWTRTCFCGQQTSLARVDSHAWIGKAAGAGSEEGRTIFHQEGLANEGDKLPIDVGPQGDKITVLPATGSVSRRLTSAAEASMYVLMLLVLLFRPRGLFGERIQRFE